jgi:2-polyprenyl-6-methoxyphenol hydroxylase-like FAD-dependent oxidoreductase
MAVLGIRSQQEGYRGQLSEDARSRASVRRTRSRRGARGAVRRRGDGELLPQTVRPRLELVGDAGYNKDPITAQGIADAFRDAELCAHALDRAFAGAASFDEVMAEYQRTRDQHVLPMYEFTCQLATLEPPPPDMQQLFAVISGNQQAMDGFVRMNAGTISPAEFLSPENIRAIMTSAQVAK